MILAVVLVIGEARARGFNLALQGRMFIVDCLITTMLETLLLKVSSAAVVAISSRCIKAPAPASCSMQRKTVFFQPTFKSKQFRNPYRSRPTMSDHCAPVLIWPWHWPRLRRGSAPHTNLASLSARDFTTACEIHSGPIWRKIEAGRNGRKTPLSSTSFQKEGLSLTLTPQSECYQKIYCASNSFT